MRVVKEVNMSGFGEQLSCGGEKERRERNFISGMKMPFAETGCIVQAHVWGKYKEFDFGLFKFELMVGYPDGAVQQTRGNVSVRFVWK